MCHASKTITLNVLSSLSVKGKWVGSSNWNTVVDPLNGDSFIKVAEVDETGVQVCSLKYVSFVLHRKKLLWKFNLIYSRMCSVFLIPHCSNYETSSGWGIALSVSTRHTYYFNRSSSLKLQPLCVRQGSHHFMKKREETKNSFWRLNFD